MARSVTKSLVTFTGLVLLLLACAQPSQPASLTPLVLTPEESLPPATLPVSIPPEEKPPSATHGTPGQAPTAGGSTPSGHLETEGPYVAYIKAIGNEYSANLLDVYGDGIVSYRLPLDSTAHIKFDPSPVDLISPSSRYFAYYKGNEQAPYDLELRIIQLLDGSPMQAIPLLAPDMDAALRTLAEHAIAQDPPAFIGLPEMLVPEELLFSLQTGIRAHGWSPIADSFAFASQADGPSSDLYTLSEPNGNLLRLTSGPQNIQRLSWSPDGRWIAHGSAFTSALGSTISNYIVSRDGRILLTLPEGGLMEGGWATSDWYFLHEAGHGSGDNSLKAVHLPDQRYIPAWPGPFTSYALDVPSQTLAVSQYFSEVSEAGTYLTTLRGGIIKQISIPLFGLVAWGRGPNRFAGSADDGVFAITNEGNPLRLFDEPRRVSISPNNELLVLYELQGKGASVVYNASSGETAHVHDADVRCIRWAPDSESFFFVSSDKLYEYDFREGTSVLIDQDLLEGRWLACPIKLVAQH